MQPNDHPASPSSDNPITLLDGTVVTRWTDKLRHKALYGTCEICGLRIRCADRTADWAHQVLSQRQAKEI